jgi:hypothetical protein
MPCVYILTNPVIPDLIKIGYTSGTALDRAADISRGTGVPSAYEVEWFLETDSTESAFAVEQQVHSELSNHRHNRAREFFTCSIAVARDYIEREAYRLGAINTNLVVLSRLLQQERDKKEYERREEIYRKILIEHFTIRGFQESEARSFADHPDNTLGSAIHSRDSLCFNILERNNFDIEKAKLDVQWINFLNEQSKLKKDKQNQALKQLLMECEAIQRDIVDIKVNDYISKNNEICIQVLQRNDFDIQKTKKDVVWLNHINQAKIIYDNYLENLKIAYTALALDFFNNRLLFNTQLPADLFGAVGVEKDGRKIIGAYKHDPLFWKTIRKTPDLCFTVLNEHGFNYSKAREDRRWTNFIEKEKIEKKIFSIEEEVKKLNDEKIIFEIKAEVKDNDFDQLKTKKLIPLWCSIALGVYSLTTTSDYLLGFSAFCFICSIIYYGKYADQVTNLKNYEQLNKAHLDNLATLKKALNELRISSSKDK